MQPNLERQLLKLISMPAPKPRHPIRRLIARCFLSLYVRGNSSTLFETVQILQSLIEAGKGMGDKDVKLYVHLSYCAVQICVISKSSGH